MRDRTDLITDATLNGGAHGELEMVASTKVCITTFAYENPGQNMASMNRACLATPAKKAFFAL